MATLTGNLQPKIFLGLENVCPGLEINKLGRAAGQASQRLTITVTDWSV